MGTVVQPLAGEGEEERGEVQKQNFPKLCSMVNVVYVCGGGEGSMLQLPTKCINYSWTIAGSFQKWFELHSNSAR